MVLPWGMDYYIATTKKNKANFHISIQIEKNSEQKVSQNVLNIIITVKLLSKIGKASVNLWKYFVSEV